MKARWRPACTPGAWKRPCANISGRFVGEDRGVWTPYPRPILSSLPPPLFFLIFFGHPRPKFRSFYPHPHPSDPRPRPFFVKSSPSSKWRHFCSCACTCIRMMRSVYTQGRTKHHVCFNQYGTTCNYRPYFSVGCDYLSMSWAQLWFS